MQHPEFFQTAREVTIADTKCLCLGNLFLLRNPDKYSLRVSDSWSDWKKKQSRIVYRQHHERGSVLVSPFLSKEEKGVLYEICNSDGRAILLTSRHLPPVTTLNGIFLSLLEQRKLLIISTAASGITSEAINSCGPPEAEAESLYSFADTLCRQL